MKIELNLLDNGLDFIIEGIKPTTRIWKRDDYEGSWKYSVLNIFSGIQLILKERLRKEHWSLIFEDVSNAKEQKLIQGDFVSVNYNNLIKRLKGISNININDTPINNLRKLRNKFEHFEAKIEIEECKHLLASAIRELIIFWNENLANYANEGQKKKFEQIKILTNEFDTYVTKMLDKNKSKIKSIVENKQGILVHCDNCSNHSFMIYKSKERTYECFVCEYKISKEDFLKNTRGFELKRANGLSFLKQVDYEKCCSKCNTQTRILIMPSYILKTEEYQSDYFFCINCLDYETQSDINSRELEKELLELEKNHSPEEFIEILKGKIKHIEEEN
ncbi:hypothetical protein [Aquimarina megaterium]|uniref:hypothetical protein n=1 Tax=Aquimarina megaterium TaxID=1443666 RepID=UPI0004713C76|nr:hypothetical protein [Aquimarina megaterium]